MNYKDLIKEKYAESVKGITEEFFNEPNTKWYKYVMELPVQLQFCYLIVVFHKQILNGGFHQYFTNGYGQFAEKTIGAIQAIGASGKAELLRDALKIVNFKNYSDVLFRKKLLEKQIPQLFDLDDLIDPLNKLDTIYYNDKKEDLEQLLGRFLESKLKP
jgi:hypothetical protein